MMIVMRECRFCGMMLQQQEYEQCQVSTILVFTIPTQLTKITTIEPTVKQLSKKEDWMHIRDLRKVD